MRDYYFVTDLKTYYHFVNHHFNPILTCNRENHKFHTSNSLNPDSSNGTLSTLKGFLVSTSCSPINFVNISFIGSNWKKLCLIIRNIFQNVPAMTCMMATKINAN